MSEVKLADNLRMDLHRQLEGPESSTHLEGTALVTKQDTGSEFHSCRYGHRRPSASPAAPISLGEKIANGLSYGNLVQLVVTGTEGYTIITTQEDSSFMLLSHCKKRPNWDIIFIGYAKHFPN